MRKERRTQRPTKVPKRSSDLGWMKKFQERTEYEVTREGGTRAKAPTSPQKMTHQVFWREQFEPVPPKSLKILPVQEGVKVDAAQIYVFKSVVDKRHNYSSLMS